MDFTLKVENMAKTLSRTNIRYPYVLNLLHILFGEWELFPATKEKSPLDCIYEELDWLLENDKNALTVDEYIVLRHVAWQEAQERGW